MDHGIKYIQAFYVLMCRSIIYFLHAIGVEQQNE